MTGRVGIDQIPTEKTNDFDASYSSDHLSSPLNPVRAAISCFIAAASAGFTRGSGQLVTFRVLENCELAELNARERFWIAQRGTLNRLAPGIKLHCMRPEIALDAFET